MQEVPNQPRFDDAIFNQAPSPVNAAVLGGLERVKQLLEQEEVVPQIDALLDAFQYGQLGLELVIQALESKSEEVQSAAYLLLQDSTEPRVRVALEVYNPYLFFKCLCTIQAYPVRGYKVDSVAVSSNRHTLVSCDCDGTIKVWNLHTQQTIKAFQVEGIYEWAGSRNLAVTINLDGKILGVGSFTHHLEVWDIKTERKITTVDRAEAFVRVTTSLDGQTFVSTDGQNYFYLWDMQTGELISCLREIPESYPRLHHIYSDSQTLVTRHEDEANSNIIHLWDWYTKQITYTFNMHSYCPDSAVISPDRRFLLSASKGSETIIVWSLKTGKELSTLTGNSSSIWSLALSLDGQTLVSGSKHGLVEVWGVP